MLLFTEMSSSSPGGAAWCSSAVWAAVAAGSGALKNAAGTNPFAAIHASGVWDSLVSRRTPSTAYTIVPSNDWYLELAERAVRDRERRIGARRLACARHRGVRAQRAADLLLAEHERIHARDVHRLRPNRQCVPGPAERSLNGEALRPADQPHVLDRYAIAAVLDSGLTAGLRAPFDTRSRQRQLPQVHLLVVGVQHHVSAGGQSPLLLDNLCVESRASGPSTWCVRSLRGYRGPPPATASPSCPH